MPIKPPSEHSASSAISTVAATGVAVATFWFTQITVFEPPDAQGMQFFKSFCAMMGVAFGFILWFWRPHSSFKPIYLFIAAALGLIAAAIGFFTYEHQFTTRTQEVALAHHESERFIVGTILTQEGARLMNANLNTLGDCEGETPPNVTLACARAIVRAVPPQTVNDVYFHDIEASRDVLNLWYRITGWGFMLAIYCFVSQYVHESAKKALAARRRRGQTPPKP